MAPLRLSALALALLVVGACAPPGGRALRVHVLDAETGAPAEGASLDLHFFPSTPEAPDPGHPQAQADAQGELQIRPGADPAIWQVRAPGYIEQRLTSTGGSPPPRYAAHADAERDGAVHLYRLPAPQLSILVGETYSGPLTISLRPAPGFALGEGGIVAADPQASYTQGAAGRRQFAATASAQGAVELEVTPLLYDLTAGQLSVRDAAGPLPWRDIADQQGPGRGVWGAVRADDLRLRGQIRLFVGTYEEYLRAQGA